MSTPTLPVHPVTGVRAVGWRKARPGEDPEQLFPIWPVFGGAEDDEDGDGGQGDDSGDLDDDAPTDDDGGGQDDDPEGAEQLGDAGKQALDRMKARLKAERERRKAAEERLTRRGQGGGESDAEEIRRKAAAEATAKASARVLRSEVRAAAAGKLADPRDALTFLDLDQFEVGEDGEVDTDEIADAIDDLIKTKPYLAAQSRPRFQGTADGGAARKASRPKQLTRADLKSMTPEAIDRAREDGRLEDLMSGK